MKLKTLTHNQIAKSMQIGLHLISLYGIYYAVVNSEWGLIGASIALWYLFFGPVGLDVGFHRLISHRSFRTNIWIERFLAIVGTLTAVGSALAWVIVHRQHHKYAETEKDPHSPYRIGNFKAWVGLWEKQRLSPSLIKDIRHDPFYLFLHNHYFKIHLAYAALLACFDPLYVIYFYAIPASLCFHSCAAIIVVTHHHGYKTHVVPDESRNSWIATLMTCGEGWHNNHHYDPKKWNTQENWWEIDPPAWMIRLIKLKD